MLHGWWGGGGGDDGVLFLGNVSLPLPHEGGRKGGGRGGKPFYLYALIKQLTQSSFTQSISTHLSNSTVV